MKANAKEKNRLIEHAEHARAKAEKANQAKSRFLAMMSHELRTPMNAILGSAQILDAMTLDNEVREHVDTLSTGGETLMAILNDVLDLSKIESGKLEVECTDFDFVKLLNQAKSLWAPRASDKALGLNFHIDNTAPEWIHSDTTRIRQILFNLLSNAIKFTESGAIDVYVKRTGINDGKARLRIAVKDTGIGISPDQREHLFNPFEQADGSITRRFGGTGLGLSISRQLATLLGGKLTVESTPGEGSTFIFDFEATPCAVPKAKQEPRADKGAKQRPLCVLVAEDNDMNLKVLRALLKPFPYDLVHAENGAVAVNLAQARAFDLVLMDIQMPQLDGIGATREIRAQEGPNQNIPIIAMTANAMAGDKENYMQAGMTGYVPKPIDARQLYTTIARAAAQGRKSGAKKVTPKQKGKAA
jgi:CheY-like chemotaxis protein/nitrogen-specific signal transduction histidine kinase